MNRREVFVKIKKNHCFLGGQGGGRRSVCFVKFQKNIFFFWGGGGVRVDVNGKVKFL